MSEIIKRDQNYRTVAAGVDPNDETSVIMFRVDPVTNYLLLDVSLDSLIVTSAEMVKRDQNHRPTYYGISDTDGTTLVPIRTDSDGKLLIQFN